MHKKRGRIKRIAIWSLVGYLLFVLVGSTAPYVSYPEVDRLPAALLSGTQYRAESEGPDRAFLVERTDDALAVRLGMLAAAESTIDLAYHTVQYGESAEAFFGEVVRAADRGVAVRIIIDGKAGALTPGAISLLHAVASHENIELRTYNPVNALRPWQWHSLLHDKFIVVDDTYLLLGGRNIGDQYFAPEGYTKVVTNDRDVLVWRTTATGKSVIPQVNDYFSSLWNFEYTKPGKQQSSTKAADSLDALRTAAESFTAGRQRYTATGFQEYLALTVPTNRITLLANPIETASKEPWVGYALRAMMLAAEESVIIQTPYATANPDFLAALGATAENVPLTLLTNSMASSPNYPAYSNYASTRSRFIATGAQIYEYQSDDSIHGKSLLIDDDLSIVGSFNMDDRSLAIDTETMLVIHSEEFAAALHGAMDTYIDDSLEVGENGAYLPGSIEAAPVSKLKRVGMLLFSFISRPFQFLM